MNNMKKLLIGLGIIGVFVGCARQEVRADRISDVKWLDKGGIQFKIYSFVKDEKEYLIVESLGGGVSIIEHKTDTIGNKK